MWNFMSVNPVGVALLRAAGKTERHNQARSGRSQCFANTPTKYLKVLSRNFRNYALDNFCNIVLRACGCGCGCVCVCVCVCVQSRYALPSKYIRTHGVESGKRAGHKGHALLKTVTELRLHLNCRRCDKPIVSFEFAEPDKASNMIPVALAAHSTPTAPSVYL